MSSQRSSKVLICDPIHADGVDLLRQQVEVDDVSRSPLSNEQLLDCIGEYHAIIVRSRTKLPAAVLQNANGLRVIGRAGAGLDGIDVATARERGIRIVNSPDASTISVAEHVFALMLALARGLPWADQSMKAGRWAKKELMGLSLAGRTLGIVGFGRIGRQVARQAKAFDMRVIVNQPRITPELVLAWNVTQMDLLDLLQEVDFLTLHVPLRPENEGMIGAEQLALFKSSAYLINTARGAIVDEEALLAALDEGRLAGAGLDVFRGEPHVNQRLVSHPRVVATPHIAASTVDAQRQAAVSVAEQVLSILR